MSTLRNLPIENAKNLADLIQVREHQVVSMSLTKSEKIHMTLFAFAKNETVSEEAYFGDTLYVGVEGVVLIWEDEKIIELHPGDVMKIPSGVLHAVGGKDEFKMLQITVME